MLSPADGVAALVLTSAPSACRRLISIWLTVAKPAACPVPVSTATSCLTVSI